MADELAEAVQIIRVAYDGIEIAMKVGSDGIEAMKKVLAVLKGMLDYEKNLGRTSMKKLLMRGGDLQVLEFSNSEMRKVKRLAKKYGILYSMMPNINKGQTEIIFHSEATPRINVMLQKLKSGQISTFDDYVKKSDNDGKNKLIDYFQKQKDGNSSSALAVGVLNALHAYKGEFVSQGVLAREACEIEINRLGQRIGIQDQFAVAHGGFSQYKFFNDGSVSITPVVCKKEAMVQLRNNLMLFYTGTTRDSRKILNEQSDTILDKTVMLDELVNTTDRAVQALYDGNLDFWGAELDRTWEIKKKFANGVSNPQIDSMYAKAKSAGALGGKILGAGGGGFMMLYVPQQRQNLVQEALSEFTYIPFSYCHEGSRIVFSD